MKRGIFTVLVLMMSALCFSQTYFTRVTDSIPNLVIMSMQFTSANRGYACGSYQTNFPGAFLRTTNGGVNWQVTQFTNVSVDDLTFVNENTGYLSCWRDWSYVYKTTNGGSNWFCADSIHTSFFRIKFFDANTGCVVAKYNTNHFTTDGGYTWTSQYNGFWHEPSSLNCLNADTWLVADGGSQIMKTTNRGINWNAVLFDTTGISSLHFINDTTGFAVSYYGVVCKTNNAGNNWTRIAKLAGGIYSTFYDARIMFPNPNTGYITSGSGMFKTTNGGFNWSRLSFNTMAGLSSLYFLNPDTGFAGGYSGFIYRTTTGGVAYVPPPKEIPTDYKLFQNYPNPFNPRTVIRFQIPKAGQVSLKVYDASGKFMTTLVNEYIQADFYDVSFDGTGLSIGVYFCKLATEGFTETKRMVLLK
ncbi:MAG: T9SS type A sorting domain-containing protein [Ignavibacteriota bacterium]